ncbi:hypothetical protein PISL3812_05454 [Talaromyces islandicus]|uniref:Uncharacterized protein n=1 Tax=Talaromyces islandicus TaxID=28573 RepID=A0A0U1LYL3_TALIS|nr:hypothetical protein PISL3812_05454 [Talaromyces islandicus]
MHTPSLPICSLDVIVADPPDRPLIRINKKGRPFSVCCICRGPCNEREEHSKLNRDKKSDGESDSKSSGKSHRQTARRRIRPSSFARIAPHPATPLPSTSEQFIPTSQSAPPLSTFQRSSPPLPRSSSARSRSVAEPATTTTTTMTMTMMTPTSFDLTAPYMAPAEVTAPLGYPFVTLPTMDEPLLQPAHPVPSMYPDEALFPISDGSFVPDSMYSGFEDVDALPEDWSTFFWSD